ncbi:N-acetylglucosamine transport system permease protein [Stackebrandtia albiflava]|uniref:N-acetylglucosamine transport system permease protein n=1 Tax=Stackebrandtia albiflava TaxID=406432 RepID=A0A562VBR6_9ACTN|nr:sugar ABC transporter permease [Stackebrandtia albiflava]TWJ15323.1 N-acetylglucosamine transport system permease protein [Stackebrandtia albiflava]
MKHGKGWFVASFLALPVGLYVWLVILPFAQAFQISLTDWSGYSPSFDYIGFDNFVEMWSDPKGWVIPGFTHTGIILLVLPVIVIVMSLFFAFMLNVGGRSRGGIGGVRGAGFYKIVYFFPQVLATAIIAMVWSQIYKPPATGGLITSALEALGLPYPEYGFMGDTSWVLTGIIAVMVWSSVGFYLVYFSSAMAAIPQDIYEAARIDGASRVKTFFTITLPLLWESVQTAWVYLGIIALDGFVLVFMMTPSQGGPNHASEVIGGVIYKFAFGGGRDAGMASAIGVVLFGVVLILTVVSLRFTRRERIEY